MQQPTARSRLRGVNPQVAQARNQLRLRESRRVDNPAVRVRANAGFYACKTRNGHYDRGRALQHRVLAPEYEFAGGGRYVAAHRCLPAGVSVVCDSLSAITLAPSPSALRYIDSTPGTLPSTVATLLVTPGSHTAFT